MGLVAAWCVAAGVVQGLLWCWVAPGQVYKVFADGYYRPLPTTWQYPFVGAALFALAGIVLGAVIAVATWRMRDLRGVLLLVTLVAASLTGALIAWAIGLLAPGVDPAGVGPAPGDSLVTAAPVTGTVLVVLAQPAVAAAVYTFLAAWSGQPDLGRSPVGAPRS